MPYTLSINAPVARQGTANLRMGVEVPINVGAKDASVPQVQYRTIGTNIDCFAQATDDGRFNVSFGIEQSSIDDQQQRGAGPVFRTFKSLFSVQLRDGGSSQHMTATDPVSGEVLKVDVTLNVIK